MPEETSRKIGGYKLVHNFFFYVLFSSRPDECSSPGPYTLTRKKLHKGGNNVVIGM